MKSGESSTFSSLLELVETLRGENGCPWDRKQTPVSICNYLVEEVYELQDAVERGEPDAICEESGDVLFHILFIASIFKEKGRFDLFDVMRLNHAKMVRRHPHVFGDAKVSTAGEVREQWNAIKKTEKKSEGGSALDSVPRNLPALMRAYRISERAARTGFDWEDAAGVMDKVREEWREFEAEIPGRSRERIAEEFGDLLFTLVNVARLLGFHPETALSDAVNKFEQRFRCMEKAAAENGTRLEDLDMDRLDEMWEAVKKDCRQSP